jgi:hypothetical protein
MPGTLVIAMSSNAIQPCAAFMSLVGRTLACFLVALLCSCSGLPAERSIRLQLSPSDENQPKRSLNAVQIKEVDEFLQISEAVILDHGMKCEFQVTEPDPSKWKALPLSHDVELKRYHGSQEWNAHVGVNIHRQQAWVYLKEYSGWFAGSKEFETLYSDVTTNLVKRFGPVRVKAKKLIL